MNLFHRFVFSLGLAVILNFFPFLPSANAETSKVTNPKVINFFEAGIIDIQNQQYEQALQDLTQSIQLNTNVAEAYSNRCLVYIQLKDYVKAAEDCLSALQLNPNNTEASLNRGVAYYRLGNYSAAMAEYDRVIEQQPKDLL